MELISWTIYDLKVCHKIFIMLVVEKENVSLLNYRGNLYAWDSQTSLSHLPATVGCDDLVSFIIPTSWVTRRRMSVALGNGSRGEKWFKVTHTSSALFTEWHLHNVLQRGELRWAAEIHHAVLQMSYWATLYGVRCWRYGSDMNQCIYIAFSSRQSPG